MLVKNTERAIESLMRGLRPEQAEFAQKVTQWRRGMRAQSYGLNGFPGTGKSFLGARIIKFYRDLGCRVIYLAPTHQALLVGRGFLRGEGIDWLDIKSWKEYGKPSGVVVTATTASFLKLEKDVDEVTGSTQFIRSDRDIESFDLIWVDEAGMLTRSIVKFLKEVQGESLLISSQDTKQLQPIEQDDTHYEPDQFPCLAMGEQSYLTQTHRYSGDVLQLVEELRNNWHSIACLKPYLASRHKPISSDSGWVHQVRSESEMFDLAAKLYKESLEKSSDFYGYSVRTIAYRNRTVSNCNSQIRGRLIRLGVLSPDDMDGPFFAGENVLCTSEVWSPQLDLFGVLNWKGLQDRFPDFQNNSVGVIRERTRQSITVVTPSLDGRTVTHGIPGTQAVLNVPLAGQNYVWYPDFEAIGTLSAIAREFRAYAQQKQCKRTWFDYHHFCAAVGIREVRGAWLPVIEYCYGYTCHRMQGSQASIVLAHINDFRAMPFRQLSSGVYTAISRTQMGAILLA
jgi:ATP-dependent exoDNAse (exonuclease V) alpha subunit